MYAVNGAQVDDQASKISIGAKSYGFILNNTDSTKTNTYSNRNTGTVSLGMIVYSYILMEKQALLIIEQ